MLLVLILAGIKTYSQTESVINGDTLTTSVGFKIAKGDELKIGSGALPDGDFKYIRVNSASVFNSYSAVKSIANSANAFPRSNSGLNFKVIRVEPRGNKKRGFVNYVVLGGFTRYEVDIENAIKSGEIIVPDQFNPKSKDGSQQLSAADELKKYKELLDSGAITPEEYAAKKKQLLGL